jgi:hypothetical protein
VESWKGGTEKQGGREGFGRIGKLECGRRGAEKGYLNLELRKSGTEIGIRKPGSQEVGNRRGRRKW